MVFGKTMMCHKCQSMVWARPTGRAYTDRGGRTWVLYWCEAGEHYIRELAEDPKKERVKKT